MTGRTTRGKGRFSPQCGFLPERREYAAVGVPTSGCVEADGGNPAVCPLQLFIHIDAYGILVAHPYQVEVGTQEIQLFAYRHGVALQVLDDVTVNARQILKEAFRQCTVFHYQFGQNAEVIEHEMRVYPPNWQKK